MMAIFDSHNYRVVREERSTVLAQVFEATHPDRAGKLLVEILSGCDSSSPALEGFERDIATVSLLGHPCVLEVLDLGALPDGTPVVISEYPDGVSLPRWLERERVAPIADALDVITGLAEALTAAHECGVSHGLVSPDQIYLAKDGGGIGLAKLRGFGQRWLDRLAVPLSAASAARPSPEEIAEDVRALAVVAELLLSPPALRGAADGLAFGTNPAVAQVIRNASAGGEDGFASPRVFAAALATAAQSGEQPARKALVPAAMRALVRWPQAPRIAIGLAAGVSLSLVVAVTAAIVSEVATPVHARSLAAATAAPEAKAQALVPALPVPARPAALASLAARSPRPRPVAFGPLAAPVAKAPVAPDAALPAATVTPARAKTPPLLRIREARRPPASPRRRMVWSDQRGGLVSVDELVKPNDTAAAVPITPPPQEPAP